MASTADQAGSDPAFVLVGGRPSLNLVATARRVIGVRIDAEVGVWEMARPDDAQPPPALSGSVPRLELTGLKSGHG